MSLSQRVEPSNTFGKERRKRIVHEEGAASMVSYTPYPGEEIWILENCSWLPIPTFQDKAKEGSEDIMLSDKSLEASPWLSPGTRPWPACSLFLPFGLSKA